MRIAIVIPSDAFKASAGATIRYRRLMDAAPAGTFQMVALDALGDTFDGYLIAKAYHPAVPALAAHLAHRGKPVVLDVFDDYFSQRDDVRMARYCRWFDALAGVVHAVTVSTPALAERLAPHTRTAPVVVPDPAPPISATALSAALCNRAPPDPDALHFGWFGIAANPLFPAGLADLAASGGALAQVPGQHRLTVLTNVERASDTALAALSRMPLPVTLAPWSPAAEAALIRKVDAVVIPVNRQPFSTAKSLNRAITALAGGAQVISLGADIYSALGPAVYRSAGDFAADAREGALRHRAEHVPQTLALLMNVAGATSAARTLLGVFQNARVRPDRPVAVLMGRSDALTVAQMDGPLVIHAAFSTAAGEADIVLGPNIRVGPRGLRALPWRLRRRVRRGVLAAKHVGVPAPPAGGPPVNPMRAQLALGASRHTAEAMARALLPDHTILFADEGVMP